jgi:hypothetical protein
VKSQRGWCGSALCRAVRNASNTALARFGTRSERRREKRRV